MSKQPRASTAKEPKADPAAVLGDARAQAEGAAPMITIARADGSVWIDLRAEREQRRVLEELFNVALGRAPDSTRSLIDQTSATPKVTKVRDAAQRMAERLGARGFEIVRRS